MSSVSSSTASASASDTARRLTSDERREQIVRAAIAVFGARGYVGATTDEVAKAAGVSQPYVVRLFGTKESLFLAALNECLEILLDRFRTAAAAKDSDEPLERRIGHVYVGLLDVRGLHQTLSHAFLLGAHPVIGPCARDGFAQVWAFLRDTGFDSEAAREFLAQGMLITTMIGLRLVDDYDRDPRITELFETCFPSKLAQVLEISPRGDDPW
jgi:AcrR family transcriptional regulator